ncbi:glycosyl hydrolase [Streptomyces sp. CA2R106]|uniref:glycosyl hydrolase n=1 Tax=Streptomyces sp. CA2R106 TaxID=3120153 RepID=UPI00300A1D7C
MASRAESPPAGPAVPAEIAAVMADPPRAFSPAALWWWSGERLERARLRAQLQRLAEGGVFHLVILNLAPSGPLFGSDADDPPFMSAAWWELLDGVCEDAAALGVFLWFYDQLGFSGADLQARLVDERPDYGGRALERVRADVDGTGVLRCPAHGQPVAGHAVPLSAAGRPAGPAVHLPVDGRAVRPPGPGHWRLTLHHHVARGFDYLGAQACAALLDRVHGAFERHLGDRLGSVVVGSFQDELPSLPTWSAEFAEEFARRRGYDLRPHLPALYADGGTPRTSADPAGTDPAGTGPGVAQVRHDYQLTRAELAEAAFFRPLAAWHERHGLLVGCDQQDPARAGHPVGGVQLYADYARTHRWFSAPGSDHHGDARVHSSLAHLYGRRRTWIEAFHSTGWGGTLEETYDWLLPWLRAGATLYNPHAVYSTTKGGWWEWAPPGTDWRQPYWRHYRVFAAAVTRLCAVLGLGRHLCDTAVLAPTTTAQAGTALDGVSAAAARAQETYLELVGDMAWFRTRPGVLDRLGRDADVIDDDSLARAEVHGGAPADGSSAGSGGGSGDGPRLCVAEERYATVLLPACTVLTADTARRLAQFATAGGRVVAVGALPEEAVGAGGAEALGALRACFADGRAAFVASPGRLTDATAGPRPRVEATVPALVRQVAGTTVVFLTAASPRATRARVAAPDARGAALGWLDARYDFDPARYAPTARVRVRTGPAPGPALLLDPFGAAPRTLTPTPAPDSPGHHDIEVPFDAGPAALLLLLPPTAGTDPVGGGPSRDGAPVHVTTLPPGTAWESVLVPTADNSWGDFDRPAGNRPEQPGLVRTEVHAFRHRVEAAGEDGVRDGWAEAGSGAVPDAVGVYATFGPHAVLRGAAGKSVRVLEWSQTRGIRKDPVHRAVLGPKGHVPEEFVHVGPTPAGTTRRVAADLLLPAAFEGHLAVGATAAKAVRLAGRPVELADGGHLALGRVRLSPGRIPLELDLTPHQDTDLRVHMALVRDAARYRRPEWITATPPPDEAVEGAVRVGTSVTLARRPARAVVQVAALGRCVLRVNGEVVGRQGGFDPYVEHAVPRVRRHEVAAALRAGRNEIVVEGAGGDGLAVLVDARCHDAAGAVAAAFHSDGRWWAERGGVRVPPVVRRAPEGDPAALHLWHRPHPLPGAAWLDPDADDGTVLPAGFAVPGRARPRVEWLWCELPPGAVRVAVDVYGGGTLFVDGEECGRTSGARGRQTLSACLAAGADLPGVRRAALRLVPEPGCEGGAALAGPLRCEVGPGRIAVGDWEDRGLAGYSGGVRYRRVLHVPAAAGRVRLDLGRVRGTAEVAVGGVPAGVRICGPYVFDLTGLVAPGPNTVDVTVFGTLAPWLDATSPTHFVFPGQRVSGLLGPVRLLTDAPPPAAGGGSRDA